MAQLRIKMDEGEAKKQPARLWELDVESAQYLGEIKAIHQEFEEKAKRVPSFQTPTVCQALEQVWESGFLDKF